MSLWVLDCFPIEPVGVTSPDDVEQCEIDLVFPEEPESTSFVQAKKSKKLPGENRIPLEIFKHFLPALLDLLTKLVRRVRDSETVFKGRVASTVLPIPK